MTMQPEPVSVLIELERMRRTMEVGFARVDGSLALLVQRSDQTEGHLADHEDRLDALERTRWPLPSVAAVTALGALGLTLYGMVSR